MRPAELRQPPPHRLTRRLRTAAIRTVLAALAAATLSGCYVDPYPYRNHYGYGYGYGYGAPGYYGRPVLVAPGYYRRY